MPTDNSTLARVLALAVRIAGPSRTPAGAGPDSPLGDDGFWLDSIALLELTLACEEAFGITFDPGRDLTRHTLRTVGTLTALIEARAGR